jgi:hypothetical protein
MFYSGYGESSDDENYPDYPEDTTVVTKNEESDDNNIYKDMKRAR